MIEETCGRRAGNITGRRECCSHRITWLRALILFVLGYVRGVQI